MARLGGAFANGETPEHNGRANGFIAKFSNDILEQSNPDFISGVGNGIKEFDPEIARVVTAIADAFRAGKAAWGEGNGHDNGGAKANWQNAFKNMGEMLKSI